jgi:hypothetical protein
VQGVLGVDFARFARIDNDNEPFTVNCWTDIEDKKPHEDVV